MSFNKKIRAASFTAAREEITADPQVPNFVADAVRELAAHAPHIGDNKDAGEIENAEIEVVVSGHIDASSFGVSISVNLVPAAAAKKTR